MIEFIGKTGKVYRKNVFGGEKYAYACYHKFTDNKLLMIDYLGHMTAEEALMDFEKATIEKKWKFTISIGKAKKEFITDTRGFIQEPEEYKGKDFSAYYFNLVKVHGKDNVKKIQEQI